MVEDRVAVAELGGQLDLARRPGPVLDGVLGHEARVERRAAADDDDLVDVAQLVVVQTHLVELEQPLGGAPPEQRVGHRPRLLVDLLAHEPVVAVLLGGGEVPVDVVAAPFGGGTVEVGHLDAVPGDRDDAVLVELHGLAGVLDERGDVGADEVLAVAEADHQRRAAPGGDHAVGVLGVQGDQGEGPLEAPADLLHGGGQVRAGEHRLLEQLRGHLGVGLRGQLDAGRLELVAQLAEVLDDPVVHQRHAARRTDVRVRVAVRRRAVGGPAGVPQACRGARQRRRAERLDEVGQLAGPLVPGDLAVGHHGDPGGVVAPVLQPAQPLQGDLPRLLPSDVAHDSAHAAGV